MAWAGSEGGGSVRAGEADDITVAGEGEVAHPVTRRSAAEDRADSQIRTRREGGQVADLALLAPLDRVHDGRLELAGPLGAVLIDDGEAHPVHHLEDEAGVTGDDVDLWADELGGLGDENVVMLGDRVAGENPVVDDVADDALEAGGEGGQRGEELDGRLGLVVLGIHNECNRE